MTPPSASCAKKARETAPRVSEAWKNLATRKKEIEGTHLRDPEYYQYELSRRDVSEVWRRRIVIASWLLNLTATALVEDVKLAPSGGWHNPTASVQERAKYVTALNLNDSRILRDLWYALGWKIRGTHFDLRGPTRSHWR